jgi:hypothetical protein
MAMSRRGVVVEESSSITFGLIRDLFDQLEANKKDSSKGISGKQLRDFLERRNPFSASSESSEKLQYPLESGDKISVSGRKDGHLIIMCWREPHWFGGGPSGVALTSGDKRVSVDVHLQDWDGWQFREQLIHVATSLALIIAAAAGFSIELLRNDETWEETLEFRVVPFIPKSNDQSSKE